MSYKFENTVSFHNNVTHKRRAKNPSFSSILLDAIYRSIDDDHHHHHHHHREYPHTTPTSPTRSIIKQQQTTQRDFNCVMESSSKHHQQQQQQQPRSRTKMRTDSTLETVDLRRAIMVESWMEKQQQRQQQQQKQSLLSSSSSSSSPHFQSQQQQKKHHFHLGDVLVRQKSAPSNRTRLAISSSSENSTSSRDFPSSSSCFTNLASSRDQSSSRIFTKTKSRALKIYGDLKRSKQQQNNTPISPGRRIAAFLNSIFRNSGNSPARDSPTEIKLNPPPVMSNSTCSSASSFSRSCLSKTSSSTTKSSSTTTTKRSVRFYPVSVIVDEDSRPCGHKSLQKSENEDSKMREKEVDALMMMMKTNCSKNNNIINSSNKNVSNFDEEMHNVEDEVMQEEEDDEDDDDGGESCASSDLFELENLSSIGVNHRYYEELPVYGTTSLKNLTTAA